MVFRLGKNSGEFSKWRLACIPVSFYNSEKGQGQLTAVTGACEQTLFVCFFGGAVWFSFRKAPSVIANLQFSIRFLEIKFLDPGHLGMASHPEQTAVQIGFYRGGGRAGWLFKKSQQISILC